MITFSLFDLPFLSSQLTDWARRVVANGGAMPSGTTIRAMETFRLGLVAAGLDTRIHSLCVFVPDSLIAATTPLIKNKGSDPWTNHSFITGDLTSEGLKGDGTSKYLDTGVQARSGQAVNATTGNVGMTVVITNSNSNAGEVDIGYQDALNTNPLVFEVSAAGLTRFFTSGISPGNFLTATDWGRSGYVSVNSVAGILSAYTASALLSHRVLPTTGGTATSGTATSNTLYAYAQSEGGTRASGWSGKRMSVAAIHDGFSSADSSTFWSLIQTLRTALAGGVGDQVTDWAAKVVRFGGAAPSAGTLSALRTFYTGLDTDGVLTPMTVLNPYVPDNLTAARTPLIWNAGNESWTNHNFVSGDITVNGLTGNTTTKYLETGITPSTANGVSSTSAGISLVISHIPATGNIYDFGVGGSANSSQFALINNAGTIYFYCWRFVNSGTDFVSFSAPLPTWAGYLSGNRTAGNAIACYRASTSLAHGTGASGTGTQTGAVIAGQAAEAAAINANGTVTGWSNHTVSFLAIHAGLTQAQSASLYARIAALRTALGGGNP